MSDIVICAGRVQFGAEWISIDRQTEFKLQPSLWLQLKAPLVVLLIALCGLTVLRAFASGPAEGIVTLISVTLGGLGAMSQLDGFGRSYSVRADNGRRSAEIMTTSDSEFAESARAFLEWAKAGLRPGEEYRVDLAAKRISRSREPDAAAA